MRRLFLSVFIVIVLSCGISASSLYLFDLDHPVYETMEALYLIEGKAAPLGSKPWSETDVRHLLEAVQPQSGTGRVLKEKIAGYLNESEGFTPFFSASFTPVFSVHVNNAYSSSFHSYDRDLLNEPFSSVVLGLEHGDNIAALMDFSLGFDFADANQYGYTERLDQYTSRYSDIFGSNIPYISDGRLSMNFPDRAYVSLGWDAMRFTIGRGRVSWGNGVLGNMIIGDTLPYHDYLSLSYTGSQNFSYQMLMSFFSHSANLQGRGDREPQTGLRFFLGHRFEMRFFDSRLMLTLNESIMYQSEEGYLDPRALNPLIFMHNFFIAGNANSLASLEVEYAPIRNLSIYLQFAVDDLAMPNEPQPGKDKGASSDGWGLMAGLRFTIPMENGDYLFGNAEAVYTSPFMYHRALDGVSRDLYYVSSNRYVVGNTVTAIARYLSFPFGSDAIAAIFRFGYDDIDLFRLAGNIFFMAHGVIDEKSVTDYYGEGKHLYPITPSTQNPFNPNESGVPEYSFSIGADGTVRIAPFFSVDAGLYATFTWNMDNVDSPCQADLRLSLGCTLEY